MEYRQGQNTHAMITAYVLSQTGGSILTENLKEKIAGTFMEMTRKKNFDKITIKDLVQECGISRQAFYYHFQDILDVIEWILQKGADELLERSLHVSGTKEAIRLFIDFSIKNRDFMHRLLASRQRERMEEMLHNSFRCYLENLCRHQTSEPALNYRDLDVALDFYTYGIAGVLMEHTKNTAVDSDILTDQLFRLLAGHMLHLPED